ncbi:hypothetical protein U1Q18_016815 [Sarracenia purpurea var. burkii]
MFLLRCSISSLLLQPAGWAVGVLAMVVGWGGGCCGWGGQCLGWLSLRSLLVWSSQVEGYALSLSAMEAATDIKRCSRFKQVPFQLLLGAFSLCGYAICSMDPIALLPTWEGISSSISRGTGEASFLLSPLGCFAWLRQGIDLLSCCNRVLK